MSEAALAKMIEIIEKATETSIQPSDMNVVIKFFQSNKQYIDPETENQDLAELALEYIEKMGLSTETKSTTDNITKNGEPKKIAIENFLGLSIPKKEKNNAH
jgi:molybdenum cofactor biosynthesis enzyme MoaA